MNKWAGLFLMFSLVTTGSAEAGTVYHFDLLNQNGTAGSNGAPNGYAGSFTTYINPSSGDQSSASKLEPHRWAIDVSQPGAPGQTAKSGVDVIVDDSKVITVHMFGHDVLAEFLPGLASVHGADGNFDFDLTVRNAGFATSDASNPLSGSVFAQVGDPANSNAGQIFPRFLLTPDAQADGTVTQTTTTYPPITELGLAGTTSLYLGFVPGDPDLRLLAAFTSLNGYSVDGVEFHTGFDISGSLRLTGSESTGAEVPEPATIALLLPGLFAAARARGGLLSC